jgi:hypothetical protein
MTNKPDLKLWTFKFVVRSDGLSGALKLLKDVTDIEASGDNSDREINGLYLIQCMVGDDKLTKDFYSNISRSENIAIHSDGKSVSLYPQILNETQQVEERLRWLLLHVSDAVEDYAELLGYKKNDIVEKGKLDPITSRLSFEAMLGLLEIDQSWARDGVTDERMRSLIDSNPDFVSFKKAYLEKTTPKTIWESISELVLERPVKWTTIERKLMSIKALRNKCAHFHTVTNDDLSQAQNLRSQIMRNLSKKKTYTSADLKAFSGLNKQLAETIKRISELQLAQIKPIAESALAAQKTMLENMQLNTSFLSSMKASETITQSFFEKSSLSAIVKAQTAAFASLPKINFPVIDLPQSTINSILQAQHSFNGLNISPQTDDTGANDSMVEEKPTDNDKQSPQPTSDDKKGEEK